MPTPDLDPDPAAAALAVSPAMAARIAAVEAAADYIAVPLAPDRLAAALDRAAELLARHATALNALLAAGAILLPHATTSERICVTNRVLEVADAAAPFGYLLRNRALDPAANPVTGPGVEPVG